MHRNDLTQKYLWELGRKICTLRKSKNLTQANLAELINYSIETISDVENGKVSPKITFIISLADCLDTDPNYFLPGKGDDK